MGFNGYKKMGTMAHPLQMEGRNRRMHQKLVGQIDWMHSSTEIARDLASVLQQGRKRLTP